MERAREDAGKADQVRADQESAERPVDPPRGPLAPATAKSVDVCANSWHKRRRSGPEIARIASRQHGVVSTEQLMAVGLTRHQISYSVSVGRLHRLYRGVYAVGHRRLTRDGHLIAGLLAAGDGAFLSHRTAAALHGLRNLNLRRIDVTVVGSAPRGRHGLNVHRTNRPPVKGEITMINGLRVSTVPRVLVELAPTETSEELGRLLTEAVRKRAFSHEAMRATLDRYASCPGIGRLNEVYRAYRPRPDRKSDLERDFDRLLDKHPEIPVPLRNQLFGPWELDCYWPEHNVVLELDGRPYHLAVEQIERDRVKDAYLLARGLRPLRVTDRRFNDDPDGAISDLKAILVLEAGNLRNHRPSRANSNGQLEG